MSIKSRRDSNKRGRKLPYFLNSLKKKPPKLRFFTSRRKIDMDIFKIGKKKKKKNCCFSPLQNGRKYEPKEYPPFGRILPPQIYIFF